MQIGSRVGIARRASRPLSQHRRYLVYLLGILSLGSFFAAFYHRSALPRTDSRPDEEALIHAPPSLAFCAKTRPPLVCAHGGDTTKAPPNTARAFRAAIDAGVDCVEIDAARTKDDELVVLHVRELQQLTGQQGKQVGDYTLAELRALRWPSGDAILTVEEAVAITSPFVSCVTLDVKTYSDTTGRPTDEWLMADNLVLLVHETACANCLIWAKSDQVVARIKEQSPGQRAGYIVTNETQEFRAAGMHLPLRMKAPEVVGAWWGSTSPELLDLVHAAGKDLFAWTCNNARMLRHVLDVGVDAVVTSYPVMAMTAIDYRIARCSGGGGRTVGGAAAGGVDSSSQEL